ncbi:lactonase family protein [Companilactobacillus mishanensis]|uniref:Lactonase family protein n=1 Tax=Companilactobacillus mishanensis TaxID=2486008 RepID=A0ABW9P8M0_9LACO|nr:lactonase family protein [Companilactobacillus mishanensis]MQS45633.1 lactonase family protein [Companilactobacillus mishanensis]MQS89005.1 lactonase family protein [Companilactobacillus mishanensis]
MLEDVLLSGYTRKTGKGVYKSQLNTETGELADPELYLNLESPTYIDVTNDLKLVALAKKGDKGGVVLYDISGETPKLLDEQFNEVNSPSFIKFDPSRNLIFSAYFHLSKVTIDKITDDNKIERQSEINFKGTGPRPEQDQSKPHYSVLTPDGKLIICDYGTDRIHIYDISDPTDPKVLNDYIAPAGYAPRHLVFHPTKPYVYVACELSSKVLVLKYEAETSRLTLVDEASVAKDEQKNTTAAIRITKDGRFLYASTRGADTIATLEVSEDGSRLKELGTAKTNGKGPRDFELDPSEKYLLAANQDSDDLTLFKRNPKKGILTITKDNIGIPECVCVHFI